MIKKYVAAGLKKGAARLKNNSCHGRKIIRGFGKNLVRHGRKKFRGMVEKQNAAWPKNNSRHAKTNRDMATKMRRGRKIKRSVIKN